MDTEGFSIESTLNPLGKELAAQIARENEYLEEAIYAFADRQYADVLSLIEKATKPTHYALAIKAYSLMQLPGRERESEAILANIKAQPSSGIEDDIGKAWLYLQEDNAEEAIRHADIALLEDNRNARAYRIRGEAKALQYSYDEAIADYTQAIEQNPSNALAYYLRAISYRKNDNLDQAIADNSNALALRPHFSLAHANLHEAYHQRAQKRLNNKDYAGAREDYTQILALNPQDIMAYNNRGMLWKLEGNLVEAAKDFRAGLAIEPDNEAFKEHLRKLLPPKPSKKGPMSKVIEVQEDNQVDYPYKQVKKIIKSSVEPAVYNRIKGSLKELQTAVVPEEEARVAKGQLIQWLQNSGVSNITAIITKLTVQKDSRSV